MSVTRKTTFTQQVKQRSLLPWERYSSTVNYTQYQTSTPSEVVDYRPIHLNVATNTTCTQTCKMCYGHSTELRQNFFNQTSSKEMDLETFSFVMSQIPTVQTVCFSGWGEPFLNGQIFEMVNFAFQYNGAESEIITNGLLIENRMEAILSSQLHTLVVSINGHTAEDYTAMTGMPSDHFKVVLENIKKLVHEKKKDTKRQRPIQVVLSFILDTENYVKVPEMIRFAQDLRVDGVVFENYLHPDPTVKSERSIFSDNIEVRTFLERIRPTFLAIKVTLPRFLDREMEHHRNCQDAFTSVSVDGDCNISACSRQLLFNGKMGKVWEPDFWNNDLYQWLRGVHGTHHYEVPRPCQNCPNNCGIPTYSTVNFE